MCKSPVSRIIIGLSVISCFLAATPYTLAAGGTPARNWRIVAPGGGPVGASDLSISDDGRFIAFVSGSLVPDRSDAFVYDRITRTFERVSGDVQVMQSWGYSHNTTISGNGLVVAFVFTDCGDDGCTSSVYVHDRHTGATTRMAPGDAPSMSADGRYTAFQSDDPTLVVGDTNLASDIFVFDRVAGTITRASVTNTGREANGASTMPKLSANGRKLLFTSSATNLVEGDTNGLSDLFVQDRKTGAVTRVNIGRAGQANGEGDAGGLSADGGIAVFGSWASNLVPGDTNDNWDVFARDLTRRTTARISVDSFGRQSNSASFLPMIDATGRYVVFQSQASNLVREAPVGMGLLLHDRQIGVMQRIDLDAHGSPGPDGVDQYAFSGNGRFIAMLTSSPLVDDDTNRAQDLYIRDLGTVTLATRFDAMKGALQDVPAPGALETALAAARAANTAGDRNGACRSMRRIEREVQARWNRDLPSAQAEALFAAAGAISRQLGCVDGAASTFRFSPWTLAVREEANARNLFTGDFDGDKLVDVAIESEGVYGDHTVAVLLGDGAGSFRGRVNTGIAGILLAAADLNGDGRTDLVVTDGDSAVRLLLNTGAGAVAFTETRVALAAPPTSAAIGDLTGDGLVDVVLGHDQMAAATVIAGGGRGRFKKPQMIDTGYAPTLVALGDVTGDGGVDLVYLSSAYWYLFIARGTGAGLPQAWEYVADGSSDFRLADLTGDGVPEVIAWNQGRIHVYRFDGNGLTQLSTVTGRPVAKVCVAELNGDDRPDLVVLEYWGSGSFSVFQGNGDGTFGIREPLSTRVSSGSVSTADMNRDGRMDLLIATDTLLPTMWVSGATVLLNKPAIFIETQNEEMPMGIGSTARITWTHELAAGTAFSVDVSRDGGKTWTIIAEHLTTRRYDWIVTGPATRHGRFRVTSLGSPSASDINNAEVSIAAPLIKLNMPHGGENWGIGTDRRIAFEHNLGVSERVHLDLSRDGGGTWTRIASDVLLNGTTSAQFATVATGPETAAAQVRVTWVRDPSLNVVSGTFRIAAPFVQLVEPVQGAKYALCTSMPVTWRHNLGVFERMNVDVSYDGGISWRPVATDFLNPDAARSTTWYWVSGPETQTGVVRVTWTRDATVTTTVGKLKLGRNEGFDCDD